MNKFGEIKPFPERQILRKIENIKIIYSGFRAVLVSADS
jgi:hypothetical protein